MQKAVTQSIFNRYHHCVNGTAYELRCRSGLVFDGAKADCMRLDLASEVIKKKCEHP